MSYWVFHWYMEVQPVDISDRAQGFVHCAFQNLKISLADQALFPNDGLDRR